MRQLAESRLRPCAPGRGYRGRLASACCASIPFLEYSGESGEPTQGPPVGRDATCRTVYTVRFRDAVYVLHAFKKKAKRGRATPQREMNVVRRRLLVARRLSAQRHGPLSDDG
ncbi:MAG: type II toxin-antitoxin system RelE/ParE family toxin [Thermoleophilia bacterium]|nr:type II toxin-antitoxin system RelE/ParE family toxin [Thermoleophilia bacterium]